jgi:cytochrome b
MRIGNDAAQAGGAMPPATVPVWDGLVRTFHWGVAGLFPLAYLTGEDATLPHRAAGYMILALLALRVAWGFVGPGHARFADFVHGPGAVLDHLRRLRDGTAPRHLGHNPAGGAMALALMAMLGVIGLTGHLMTTDAWWGSETLAHLHEFAVNATLGLVGLHLLGNVLSSRAGGENLVMAMITGRKRAQ